jgi:alpha-galactosidase
MIRLATLISAVGFLAFSPLPLRAQKDMSLALTPPMSWNSWNVFAGKIDEQQLKEIADAMVSTGMRDAGYVYLNIDDNWMAPGRDPLTKKLRADPVRFPRGIKQLADYVHARGLKLGIYGDRGTMTCLNVPESGSKGFEELDAQTFAEWEVDYLKYDNCNADSSTVVRDYHRMGRALFECGRPVVFSVCEWGENNPTAWAPAFSHLWRTTPDITDTWPRILKLAHMNNRLARFQAPGGWNDPDMLEVGNGGCTYEEYKAHFSLWCIMAAPLITGCDLRNLNAETKAILLNKDLIAVDQDAAGIQGEMVRAEGGQLWVKPLGRLQGGEKAVLLFNPGDRPIDIRFELSEVGLRPGPTRVRDLWQNRDLEPIDGLFTARAVPAHGCVALKLTGEAGRYTLVPSLSGLEHSKAGALLEQYGLRLGTVRSIQTDKMPPGYVIRQAAEPGRQVFERTAVNLEVSARLVPEPGKFFVEEWSRPQTDIQQFPDDKIPNRTWYADRLSIEEYHGDTYSLRFTGLITPPVTGEYRFTIAANDEGQLWLSTDARPENKRLLCGDKGTLSPKAPIAKESQTSKPVALEKGRSYYLEARLSENWSEDFLKVGWIRPDGSSEAVLSSSATSAAHESPPPVIPWLRLRNPVYQHDGWSVKDGTMALPAEPIGVELDFNRPVFQLDGTDGASVCQFHSAKPDGSAAAANVAYSTLGGFPDDAATTEFGKFCDTAFSTNGMALSQIWVTPCPLQTPRGSVGDHYSPGGWPKLDFSMYEANILPTNRFYNSHGKDAGPIRGHTVTMLQASLRRARAEGTRVSYWIDVHTDFPPWMWKDGLRKNPVRDDLFEEAALHIVYFVKYLTAKHGIPIHAASFINEPDMPNRHAFTPEQLLRGAKLLRERLDEAGLTGVRVVPCTAISLNKVHLDWANKDPDTLNQVVTLLEGSMKDHAPFVDILAGHGSQSETPISHLPPNVRFWRASGDFNEHWTNTVGFEMGPPSMLDEVVRHNTWLYGQRVAQCGIWQVASRMGIGGDFFRMPERFDKSTFGRREAIEGAAAVYPHLRPGMSMVQGSQGRAAREPYSVDGFGGRGHREVVVISNDGQPRAFAVQMTGVRVSAVDVVQTTVQGGRKRLEPQPLRDGVVNLTVPADSVTALVTREPATKPRVYLVVKDTRALTVGDRKWQAALAAYDTILLPQSLSAADQDALQTKRHPVDAFGAAAYVISDSVDRPETVTAHHVVMAPVIALGESAARFLGLRPGTRRAAGESLAVRTESDPPAAMLDQGLPRACGPRASLRSDGSTVVMERLVANMLGQ